MTKLIAFHLPQFHRVPENDLWWGDGFTEWTNVKKSRPLFIGHHQPRVPYAENYYDLLNPDTRKWQADLAKKAGIHGFCYYHYWFNGKRLLERPVNEILKSKEPDFPFCLSWANEPWTRTWEGNNKDVLMSQTYGESSDWLRHIDELIIFFKDNRYIKVDGKPMFLIYRPSAIPRLNEMINVWRNRALSQGLPGLHLVGTKTIFGGIRKEYDLDHWVDFEPLYTFGFDLPIRTIVTRKIRGVLRRIGLPLSKLWPSRPSYELLWTRIISRKTSSDTYLGGFIDWDNSARKGKDGLIVADFSLDLFKHFMRQLLFKSIKAKSDFIFINAWNEWAEGTYLEPDIKWGNLRLEAIQSILEDISYQRAPNRENND